ncbi:transposase [Nitrosomonas mobilis]|uniref:transposase n=1 Tax=Nitrosomonas mobilis TaxID=51642 RepID=UPI003CCC140E
MRCAMNQRKELEHLCCYITRPPVVNERLALNDAGQVVLTPKTPYRDGTTHIVMPPLEFMQRLATLVPRPRLDLFVSMACSLLSVLFNTFCCESKINLRISGDFPVRLTTKPFLGTLGSYEKGRLFCLYPSCTLMITLLYKGRKPYGFTAHSHCNFAATAGRIFAGWYWQAFLNQYCAYAARLYPWYCSCRLDHRKKVSPAIIPELMMVFPSALVFIVTAIELQSARPHVLAPA